MDNRHWKGYANRYPARSGICPRAGGRDDRGEDSLAAKIRDALVDSWKSKATVWRHTEVGHTTRNPSLRYFYAGSGKGTKGKSYVGEFVFGTVNDVFALDDLEATMRELGFSMDAAL
jgi:hypothetical protein